VRLTERDQDLFALLATAGLLTTDQVAQVIFPGLTRRRAQGRLQVLEGDPASALFLERRSHRSAEGAPLTLWQLTALGHGLAEARLGPDCPPLTAPAPEELGALLRLNGLLVDLVCALGERGRVERRRKGEGPGHFRLPAAQLRWGRLGPEAPAAPAPLAHLRPRVRLDLIEARRSWFLLASPEEGAGASRVRRPAAPSPPPGVGWLLLASHAGEAERLRRELGRASRSAVEVVTREEALARVRSLPVGLMPADPASPAPAEEEVPVPLESLRALQGLVEEVGTWLKGRAKGQGGVEALRRSHARAEGLLRRVRSVPRGEGR
jgi:hypothetical protein